MSIAATPYHSGKHLAEDELMSPTGSCPGCGRRGNRKVVIPIQRNPDVAFLHCPACGLVSASRMPTPAALDAYYASYYSPDGEQYTFAGATRFGRHLARFAPAGTTLRILDFGGGDGSIALALARAAQRPATITVIDRVAPRTAADVEISQQPQLPDRGEQFDFIVASAILEHIPDLAGQMRALFERLAPGGVFYARTPWVTPIATLAPRFDLGFPGHVHDIGPEFFARAPSLYAPDLEVVVSQPSIVETELRTLPLRTALAWTLKAPSWLESRIRGGSADRSWKWVGGWEIVYRRPAAAAVP